MVRYRRIRPAARRIPGRPPGLDADLHAYVLNLLDAHLASMRALRSQLSRPCAVGQGDRRQVAAAGMLEARRFAQDLAGALGGTAPGHTAAGDPREPAPCGNAWSIGGARRASAAGDRATGER